MATRWSGLMLAAAMLAAAAVVAAGSNVDTVWAQGGGKADSKVHKVAIQVSENDKAQMTLALNNAKNIADYYKTKGETALIEIVTYGPGLHMLRADTSPVKDRIGAMALENPNLKFIACGNTQANQSKAEGKEVALISEATVMPSGAVRLMELQAEGYAYLRP